MKDYEKEHDQLWEWELDEEDIIEAPEDEEEEEEEEALDDEIIPDVVSTSGELLLKNISHIVDEAYNEIKKNGSFYMRVDDLMARWKVFHSAEWKKRLVLDIFLPSGEEKEISSNISLEKEEIALSVRAVGMIGIMSR